MFMAISLLDLKFLSVDMVTVSVKMVAMVLQLQAL